MHDSSVSLDGDEMEVYADERLLHLIKNSQEAFCGLRSDSLTKRVASIHENAPWCQWCFDERLSCFLDNER